VVLQQPDVGAAELIGSAVDSAGQLIAGVDLGVPSEAAAEVVVAALAERLLGQGVGTGPLLDLGRITIGTHRVTVPDAVPRVALSIGLPAGFDGEAGWRLILDALPPPDPALPEPAPRAVCLGDRRAGPVALVALADRAARQRRDQADGRAVVFPGVDTLVGTVSVEHILTRTAIDRLVALDGATLEPSTRLVTRDFVRPRWTAGELVLHVQRAARDTVVPFEVPTPTPCCAEH
jgi:hypothetical protein